MTTDRTHEIERRKAEQELKAIQKKDVTECTPLEIAVLALVADERINPAKRTAVELADLHAQRAADAVEILLSREAYRLEHQENAALLTERARLRDKINELEARLDIFEKAEMDK